MVKKVREKREKKGAKIKSRKLITLNKLITLLICLTLIQLSITNINYGKEVTFTDVKETDWFYENVTELVKEGIINGFPDGSFRPNDTIMIDQFIKTMIVALGEEVENSEGYWADNYIKKAKELKIIDDQDYSDYTKPITRGQMAKISEKVVEKLEGKKKYTLTNTIKEKTVDNDEIEQSGLSSYIYHMYELGIITGYTDNTFRPNNSLTRAEASTVIRRIIDESVREKYEVVEYGNILISENGKVPNAFGIWLDTRTPLEPQWEEAEKYLMKTIGEKYTKEIMEYVKQKKTISDELPLKFFGKWKKLRLYVKSGKDTSTIIIGASY